MVRDILACRGHTRCDLRGGSVFAQGRPCNNRTAAPEFGSRAPGEEAMATTILTRRTLLKSAMLATTALATPYVRGAYAAGKLSCGFWDHWVPGANEPLAKLCREWAEKEKVDLKIDFITT